MRPLDEILLQNFYVELESLFDILKVTVTCEYVWLSRPRYKLSDDVTLWPCDVKLNTVVLKLKANQMKISD